MNDDLTLARLQPADRAAWGVLAEAYKRFYETELPASHYDATWARLVAGQGVFAWGAHRRGRLVGIVHYLFHANPWMADACYLQDLYVDEATRGLGVAAALIERVAASAREHGAARLHWLTHESNARARALYDRVAQHRGFIRYDFPLG
ncbi:N-acetyltransferase [Ideonella sp. A 288]|uniref:GNAT family N-acetyltransferase n=1 Tax=Ideonella sp. A 288 TaxID=1962181 RepID=UPI000B4B6CBC|nr:GNAT family N-acetyltransferase [Ideonella sp. A 288]